MGPYFPGDGWTPACRWEVVNEFLVLLCLHAWLLLYLLTCLYLNPRVFSLFLCRFSPPSHQGGVSERLCGASLPAGVKLQHWILTRLLKNRCVWAVDLYSFTALWISTVLFSCLNVGILRHFKYSTVICLVSSWFSRGAWVSCSFSVIAAVPTQIISDTLENLK